MHNQLAGEEDADYYTKRAQSIGRILALPVSLETGEHLKDAAFRAAAYNQIPNTGFLAELAQTRSFRTLSGLSQSVTQADLRQFAEVLGLRPELPLTRNVLEGRNSSARDWVSFFGVDVRRRHIAKSRRVSPRALRKFECMKAMWSLRPIAFDISTKEQLLDHCPVCNKELGWSRSHGVNFCGQCPEALITGGKGADLRQFPQPLVEISDEAAIDFVADLIDPESRRSLTAWPLHRELADQGPAQLFQFAIQIAMRVDRRPSGWGGSLTSASLEKAGRAILDWPNGFDTLSEAFCLYGYEAGEPNHLERLRLDPTLSPEIRALVRDCFDKRLQRCVVRKANKAQEVVRFSTLGSACHGKSGRTLMKVVLRSQADMGTLSATIVLLRNSKLARQVASALGLPTTFLVDLYDAGLLPELIQLLEPVRGRPRSVVQTSLLNSVKSKITSAPQRDDLPLWRVAFASAQLTGSHWSQVFRSILDGDVRVAFCDGNEGLVRSVHCSDFKRLRDLLTTAEIGVDVHDFALTQCDASASLGRSRTVIRALAKADLVPNNPAASDLARLRREWMFFTEVRDLALLGGIPLEAPMTALSAPHIKKLDTGPVRLYSRADVQSHLKLSR